MAAPELFYSFKKDPPLEVSPGFGEQLGINYNERCQSFMEKDLARSGLTSEDVWAYIAPMVVGGNTASVNAAYKIPYHNLDGKVIKGPDGYCEYYACRKELKPTADPKAGKYFRPGAEQIGQEMCCAPYVHPSVHTMEGDVVAICEGEKKAASVIKHIGIPAIGIGGMANWRSRAGKTELHPWIIDWIRAREPEQVLLVPDGDIIRFDVNREYGTFSALLTELNVTPVILDVQSKIDDLIVIWGPEKCKERFYSIPHSETRIESAALLIQTYGLSYSGKTPKIEMNESNFMILMRNHPSVPDLWLNKDEEKLYMGDGCMVEGEDDVDLLAHMQHNLGLTKAKASAIRTASVRVARENARSPMLDWVHSLTWDGKPRIARFFTTYCGSLSTPSIEDIGMKWLVSSIGRMTDPGCKVDWMLVTVGPQKIGKSSLPGIIFGGDRVIDLVGSENQYKDMLVKMHMGLCANFEELAVMGNKEITHLKGMISATDDTFRAAYARDTISKKRRFVLYGSTNDPEFLNYDPSGQRRYAVVPVTQVDFKAVERDRAQLWAEALQVYDSEVLDFSNILQDESIDEHVFLPLHIERLKDAFMNKSIQILDFRGDQYISNFEIIKVTHLDDMNARRWETKEIRNFLRSQGWEDVANGPKVKGVRHRRGWVKEKPPAE